MPSYKNIRIIQKNGQVTLGKNARNLPYEERTVIVKQVDKDNWLVTRIRINVKSN